VSESITGYVAPQSPAFSRIVNSTPVSLIVYVIVVGFIAYSAYSGAQSMGYNWQWYRVPQYFYTLTDDGFEWGEIFVGLVKTLELSILAFVIAILLGLVVALLRLSSLLVGKGMALVFLELVRNMPLLVLLYLFYYVLGPIFDLDRYWASILCLAVYHGAMVSEIFRAGINAVPVGQWEGARSIGMSQAQVYRFIVLPQSIRFMLPPLTGEAVNMIKSSAIVSVIAVAELTTIGRNIISDTYMSFEIWFTIAVVYLVVTLILSVGVSLIERRYALES